MGSNHKTIQCNVIHASIRQNKDKHHEAIATLTIPSQSFSEDIVNQVRQILDNLYIRADKLIEPIIHEEHGFTSITIKTESMNEELPEVGFVDIDVKHS